MASPVLRRIARRALLVALAVALAWLVATVVRSVRAYQGLTAGRGWSGRVHDADPELGLCTLPGARGAETFPSGPPVEACIDRDGFRVPADAPPSRERTRPLVLALGCSYTYGAACKAEETFPFLVARDLRGTCLDAGVCSFGLAQMLLRARALIPAERPEFVLFQHSPWLATRSRARFAPTYFGLVPTPSFERRGGALALVPPRFAPRVFDLPVEDYGRESRGVLDFLSFEWRVGLPLFAHDDWQRVRLALEASRAEPASEDEIVAFVHAEVEALCARSGANLVYVRIDESLPPAPLPAAMLRARCTIADASAELLARLHPREGASPQELRELYQRAYAHWAGDPPQIVDLHPNPAAHRVIADTILRAVGERR